MARKAQLEQTERPADKEAASLHQMLAGIREQMEYMLREQFTAVEAAALDRMKERDARIAAAEALIQRLQEETAEREVQQGRKLAAAEALIEDLQRKAEEREAEAQRAAEKMAKLRQLALESG